MRKITVDFNKPIGKIKPMHGVGQPPFSGVNFSMCDYLKAAHIPYSRLHDVGGAFGGNMFVDIPNIFRDFNADPKDPASYDFAFTDLLITALVERGIEPFFRLGVTIENYREIKAYRIDPPSDYDKWAEICEGIVRHYTEGWANGFNYRITYWEIWNEPDNFETPEKNQMWAGSPEDYFRLYDTASKHLKKCFPNIKVGGYASCGFYALTDSSADFAACSPRYRYFVDFFDEFLKYISEHNCPLDFFSWHSYAEIENNVIWSEYVSEKLREYGYTDSGQTMNEWNCHPELKGTAKHAALTMGMMCAMQNASLDSAMFYDARCGMGVYSSMFDCMTYKPLPTYYSFLAFGELYKRSIQVYIGDTPRGVYALAAKDKDGCLVIANTTDLNIDIELEIFGLKTIKEYKIISHDTVWETAEFTNSVPADSVIYIEFAVE